MAGREIEDLDAIDRRILACLEREGRITNLALARAVGLSPTPCLERVRRLEREGFILGYHAKLDPARMNRALVVFVQVILDRTTPDGFNIFADAIRRVPDVVECHMVAGGYDYLVKVRTSDMGAYREVLGNRIAAIPGVMQTHSYVVMEEILESPHLLSGRVPRV